MARLMRALICSSMISAVEAAFGVFPPAESRHERNMPAHRLFAFAFTAFVFTAAAHAITVNTVPVGNVGNGNDPVTGNFYGGVNYAYSIGTTEVTNAQYAAFLNEKAKSDPLALYNTNMGGDTRGGIMQSGSSPNFSYVTKLNMGNKPVNFVSWYDSIRFANWLNNGQGAGDTETGAYALNGGVPIPSNGPLITRILGATWFLPSENEWYKAAYHEPAAQGGDADNYFSYPTRSNGVPTIASANGVGDANPGINVANFSSGADWNSQDGNVTTVGSTGPSSASFYGTADQGGNVWEWNEALISGPFRGLRGGGWSSPFNSLQSAVRSSDNPANDASFYGFRVATVSGLPGDYNRNGVVDAADYVVWRANQGTTDALANDPIGGTIGTAQYNQWRAHFGQTAGSGTGAIVIDAVPEPATAVLLMAAAAGWCLPRRRAT
jgi:formylglycine-generating enzyme